MPAENMILSKEEFGGKRKKFALRFFFIINPLQ